jgi:predicted transcriptional regulator
MTNRDFYTAVINANINDDLTTFAKSAIEKLDKKNNDRKTKLSPNQKANEDIKTEILNLLATAPQSAKTIVDNIGYNTQKISALVKQLVDNGLVKVDKAKFAGSTTKVNVYSLVENEVEETEDEIEETESDVE